MYKKLLYCISTLLFVASASAWAQDTFWLGADTGWSTEYEHKGYAIMNWQGQKKECTEVMHDLGFNAIRIRVWVDPSKHDGWCGKEDVLLKAKRAKAQGMEVMIDFHYSDWWADPQKQNIPQAWEKMSYKKMLAALSDHTIDVLNMLKQNDITPRWVQVGNETSNGMLWSVETDPVTGWEKKDEEGRTTITKAMGHWEQNPKQYAGFIGAGYDAVKKVFPNAIVIVHLDNGFDNALYNKNLDIIRDNGGKWDMIGMSLYPYWAIESGKEQTAQRTIVDCIRNIRKVSEKYNCDVMIVETGYQVDPERPWVMEQGREQYAELIRRAKTETNGRCKGVWYWEPECRPSQYKLGAFNEDGTPTSILRAMWKEAAQQGKYDRPLVKLETTVGDIIVELYNETPRHRDNWLRLAKSGALDGTLFHRVIENFMIQGGDPKSKDAPATSKENPAPLLGDDDVPTEDGEKEIAAEIVYPKFFHKRGAVASAREGDEDNPELRSSASQFYIVWGKHPVTRGKKAYRPLYEYYETDPVTGQAKSYLKTWDKHASPLPESQPGTPWLDGGYTVFGEVVEGLDVVEKIQQAETDSNDRPLQDVRLVRMTVIK